MMFLFCTPLLQAEEINGDRISELKNMVLHDCGGCHGITLTGGLGPALTQEALKHKDNKALLDTILDGRPGTAMPPWNIMLSETEAEWIVSQLKAGALKP